MKVIHRDIKPSNLLVNSNGIAREKAIQKVRGSK
jgi:serine/threonine protein kinase